MIIIEGCRYKHTSYSDFRSLGNQGWPATEPLEYVLKGVDSLAMPADSVYVTIRHNNDYRYCNLWLFVDYVYPDTVTTDTVECMLSDKFGKWYGSGDIGQMIFLAGRSAYSNDEVRKNNASPLV